MFKEWRGINSLAGCILYSAWMSAGYAAFLMFNGLASWLSLAVVVGLGFVFILCLGFVREDYGGLKKERLASGFFLLAMGFLFVAADQAVLSWFIGHGFTEPWLKKCAEAVIVWGVSLMITGLWLLLVPPKRVPCERVPCTR